MSGAPASSDRKLDRLVAHIVRCRACIEQPEGKPLPHEPRPVLRVSSTARIVIAGQAPGTIVHETGLPFNDPSGDRLRDWMGVDREIFYDRSRIAIVPMGFCFPGQDHRGADLPPRRECAPLWRRKVFELLPSVELLLTIGQYAHAWHLGADRRDNLTETVRDWKALWDRSASPKVLAMPHPSWRNNAWIRRNPWFESELVPHLRAEVARLVA